MTKAGGCVFMSQASPLSGAGLQRLRALARGRVQGVSFRAFVQDHARRLALYGIARNLSDGSTVEIIAEGPQPALEELLRLLWQGPPGAHVRQVEVQWSAYTGEFNSFQVC